MTIPVYVVTGFLDSGKTTFLNTVINRQVLQDDIKILVIQFEAGEEEFSSEINNCDVIIFPKKVLDHQPKHISEQIIKAVRSHNPDEIWIEWNGVVSFSLLQSLLLHYSLRNLCKIQKVIHITDGANIENLLGKTGVYMPEQIANCDFVVVRNIPSTAVYNRIQNLLNGLNPGVKVYKIKEYKDLLAQLNQKNEHPLNEFLLSVIIIVALVLVTKLIFELFQIPVNKIINLFIGIILQAIPFLLLGVLISSAIQVFIPKDSIERRFPKSIGMGMLVAILGGFCLPVCDCASIPIFRSLVKKGIPLPVAVTFMTVAPVINPVVILSTYYAFSGNISIVLERVCFGIIAAVLIGFVFAVYPPKGHILSGGALDNLMCSCGCFEDAQPVTGFKAKFGLLVRHSQAEFFSVGKYLVIGAFISSLFQSLGTGVLLSAHSGADLAFSIIIMMVMAFALSLCSSSDAVIARSFANQIPMGAVMGFLLFGPMIDIKNMMMLSSGFSKSFIWRLLFTTFIVCFVVVFLLSDLGGM